MSMPTIVSMPIESATAAVGVVAVPRLVVRVNESCLPVFCSWLNAGTGSRLYWPLIAHDGGTQQELQTQKDNNKGRIHQADRSKRVDHNTGGIFN
jgi:hypothetical protein